MMMTVTVSVVTKINILARGRSKAPTGLAGSGKGAPGLHNPLSRFPPVP